jgi:hypothetical protein
MTFWRRARQDARVWWLAVALAAVFLAGHLPFLASTLEDIDSINFALGVRDFDPGRHQPHPPGYPIYIALAKLAHLALNEPHALAVWGALFGALSVFPLLSLFQCLDRMDARLGAAPDPAPTWVSPAALATLLTVTAPLYWMTAVRPMSDMVGFGAVVLAQALLAAAFVRQFQDMPVTRDRLDAVVAARSGRIILFGALPLLAVVLVSRAGRGAAGAWIGASIWFTGGILVWLVPLLLASGGPSAYLRVLRLQAAEDWARSDLLATHASGRRLAFGLYDTFIAHWPGLGWMVVALAAVGAVAMLWRQRRAFVVLVAAFAPYLAFHIFFQESAHTRYALPLVPAVAYCAVRGLWLLGRMPAVVTTVSCLVIALVQVVPVTALYSSAGSPVSRALADVRAEAERVGHAVLARHVVFVRAIEAGLNTKNVTVLSAAPNKAWPEMARHLIDDVRTPLWLLGIPQRTHLALVDPASRIVRGAYRWPFASTTFLGGERPSDVDWLEVRNPGWVALDGWHLTPETAGQAVESGTGLGVGPITASVRTRSGAAVAMIGGRNLGRRGDPDLAFSLRIGGREIAAWTVPALPAFFLRFVPIPAGTLAGTAPWLPLTIEARRSDTGQYAAAGAVEQFDLQDAGTALVGYGAGWHEQELNTPTGVLWRWTSERAVLLLPPVGRDVVLEVRGESPLRNFARPSRVTVRAGDRVLLAVGVAADFAWSIDIPAGALVASGGTVTIETDQTFRPADRGENQDRRTLGLRVFQVTVKPSSPRVEPRVER